MERIKRQLDDIVYNNKKQKVEHELRINKSYFENLANETIYEIFEYLDVYHSYKGFFHLNQRFESLVVTRNRFIQINVTTMSKSNLDDYHNNMIKPNKYRINYIRLSNPFTVDFIFSPPRSICNYIQLETLIFDNIDTKYLDTILKNLRSLPKLNSLTLNCTDYNKNLAFFFGHILSLSNLKYCKITYAKRNDQYQPLAFYMNKVLSSPIEYLILNNRFPFDSLGEILPCLPKLRYLSIDSLVGSNDSFIYQKPIILKDLKHVSITVDNVHFYLFCRLVKTFFSSIEILHLTTYDPTYLQANQWQELIVSSMPNLRIFDIYHSSILQSNELIYLLSIYGFGSSFWTRRQWFIKHESNREAKLNRIILYSRKPYRREDYTFYWDYYPESYSERDENNFDSVKHVRIANRYLSNFNQDYFPNATELTIEEDFKKIDNSTATTLNTILPLKQLNKLVINSLNFSFEQLINLIRFMSNLSELKLNLLSFKGVQLKSIEENDNYQFVSNNNNIKTIEICETCSLENFQMIINVFRQVEYLKIGLKRKEINQIIRFLSSKMNDRTCRLCFICISQVPKVCLKELNALIKSENLFINYSIKYINRDLYLWW